MASSSCSTANKGPDPVANSDSETQSPASASAICQTPEDVLPSTISDTRLKYIASSMAALKNGGSLPCTGLNYSYASGYVEAKKLSAGITKSAPRLQKRLIICCDGTWNNGLSTLPHEITNVCKLARCIFPEDRRTFPPKPQLVYYQAGLGTSGDPALNLAQGATGVGISAKIREAYAFIAQNYIPGDEVFLFGFSRGAFTARTIASMIADIGILTNAGMEDFYQVLASYQVRGEGTERSERAEQFLDNYRRGGRKRMREIPEGTLKCVGVWDTVGALGIPRFFGQSFNLLGFRDTKLSHQIQYAFHAIAIHETRQDYMPTKWIRNIKPAMLKKNPQVFKQVWFSGSHADVGGGYKDHDLSDISLIWMVANLIEYKLLSIDEEYLMTLPSPKAGWGKRPPHDPRKAGITSWSSEMMRQFPTSWHATTAEKIHPSVGCQENLVPELAKIFEDKENQVVDNLLPFEQKMREKWDSFVGQTDRCEGAEDADEVGVTSDGTNRTVFKDVWETMTGLLDVGRLTLAKLKSRESDEVLAYQVLESPVRE